MIKLMIPFLVTMAAQAEMQPAKNLTLRLQSGNIPGRILLPAKAGAASLLSQLGLRVIWRDGAHEPVERACGEQVIDVRVIDVLILDRTPAKDHPGALAYSLPFARSGFRVVVFYDRVAAATLKPSAEVLGHVIAHEVGHMLMGTFSHARTGVMKAHWSGGELISMQSHAMQFTQGDVDFIEGRWRCAGSARNGELRFPVSEYSANSGRASLHRRKRAAGGRDSD